jgi:ribosome maturation factor RimP
MARKQSLISTIQPVCEKLAADMGLSFYDVSLDREPAGLYLRIYIDAEGGLSLDQCEAYHRAVQPKVERYEYDFLEVCSPGIDRPVKTEKDIERALGTTVSVHLFKAQDGRKDFEGTLLKMDGETVAVSENGQEFTFPRAQVSLVKMVPDLSAPDDENGDAVEILDAGLSDQANE